MSESKAERRKRTINRIRRVQGQLAALERKIEADSPCEELVTQARAIEKAISSLMLHMVGGYLRHQARDLIANDPDQAIAEIERVLELMKR